MKDVGKFYGNLVYFNAISYIIKAVWHFLCSFWCRYFPRFGLLYREKSGNPAINVVLDSGEVWQQKN
jgi:hypothetical protein